jgi:hypothetical protein
VLKVNAKKFNFDDIKCVLKNQASSILINDFDTVVYLNANEQ